MFFKPKKIDPKVVTKEVITGYNNQARQRNLERLGTLFSMLHDSEMAASIDRNAVQCESMELYAWVLNTTPLQDLELGLRLTNEWCLRKYPNKPLQLEQTGA